jgi:hypothetical protein
VNRPDCYIAVVGSSVCNEETAKRAYDVGYELARRKAIVICGGKGGVMAAAAHGARDGGGTSVGILPGSDRNDASKYLSLALSTGLGEARNAVIASAADAVIAISGGFGTLSEVALALKKGKPVVGLLFSFEDISGLHHAKTPQEAVDLALRSILRSTR